MPKWVQAAFLTITAETQEEAADLLRKIDGTHVGYSTVTVDVDGYPEPELQREEV